MPTFMLDSGRLAPVAHPGIVPDGFTDHWCDLVRQDVLDLAECDAFPVVWDSGHPPLLSAMRADGAGLGAAVLPRLDLVTLADLLARAGQVATRSWADLANQYPRGSAALRRDWNAFREARPHPASAPPRLVVITGSISAQVTQALPLLGRVQILLAQVRHTADGAQLLDLEPVPAGTNERSEGVPGDTEPGDIDAESTEIDAATPVPTLAEQDASSAPADPPSSSAAEGADRSAAVSAATPARHHPVSAPTPAQPPETGCPDLRRVTAMLKVPVSIEFQHGSVRQQATLHLGGRVEFADGSVYTDLTRASAAVSSDEPPDPWQAWRFTNGHFPLAEARTEARAVQDRSEVAEAPDSAKHGRRARS